ncbi:MAG: energy-coupling factor ABC transporter ATP-binding protein [Salinarimonas sp.]
MSVVFENVNVRIAEREILAGIDLELREQRVGVIGANGSGKSTFARLINGLVLPVGGTVTVFGADTRTRTRDVRRKVGFVFQNPDNQIVFPIVSEDVAFGLRNIGQGKAEASERAAEVLQRYGLAHLADRPAHALSGGEKQMVALASVLVMEPAVLVLDEPTTLLDLSNRNRVRGVLESLPQMVVVVTHDLELVASFDRLLVVDEGRIAVDDRPKAALDWYRERRS